MEIEKPTQNMGVSDPTMEWTCTLYQFCLATNPIFYTTVNHGVS